MKRMASAVAVSALLAGCVASPPRVSYFPSPPAYRVPPPPAQASLPASVPQTSTPYSQQELATGIAEAWGLATLIGGGLDNTPPPRGGGGGGGLPDFRLHGPSHSDGGDPPEPYPCSWGYATLGTCVGPRQ